MTLQLVRLLKHEQVDVFWEYLEACLPFRLHRVETHNNNGPTKQWIKDAYNSLRKTRTKYVTECKRANHLKGMKELRAKGEISEQLFENNKKLVADRDLTQMKDHDD